jgi:hypothetical protein
MPAMIRLRSALPLALLLAGCPSKAPPTKATAPTEATPTAAAPTPAPPEPLADGGGAAAAPATPIVQPKPAAKSPKPGTRDLAGLKLELKKDGSAHLTGKDRWGQKIDTTYESAAYLRDAIPVLKRAATDQQSAALDKLAAELAPAK